MFSPFHKYLLYLVVDNILMNTNFSKLLITETVLDKLGFAPYNDLNGDCGSRILRFKDGSYITIWEHGEKDDDSDGYSKDGIYISHHFYSMEENIDLHFLHELHKLIRAKSPASVSEFEDKCKQLKMFYYIKKYTEWQNQQQLK